MAVLFLLIAQLALALVLAPLVNGLIKSFKAGWQNRRGPGLLQPWFDLVKYLNRESVVSEHASWIFRWAPIVYFSTHLAAAGLVPMFFVHAPLARVGDAIVLMGLFALARFALSLAALDTGSNFGGMGTSRELTFAALVEPALILGIFALAIPAGSTSLDDLTHGGIGAAALLALAALFIVAIAETGRIPVDNPDTHLELTMAHEGMLLEYAGRPLGLLLWATHVKQLVILSLIAALFFPAGLAQELTLPALALGVASYVVKVAVLGLALGLVETSYAKLRIFRVPELLGAASLLGLMAVMATYVVGG
ncbi:MAG: NADH-quinone oxidoreductase subunit H [Chloroflexi bacterium]|nr:NADH-quinone oxidoreductase subunit H [Chloroflexota bacterium]